MKIIITENKIETIGLNWLNKYFGDLTPIIRGNKIYYSNSNDDIILFHYPSVYTSRFVYVDDSIYRFFEDYFSLSEKEIKPIISKWLDETYHLKDFIPTRLFQ